MDAIFFQENSSIWKIFHQPTQVGRDGYPQWPSHLYQVTRHELNKHPIMAQETFVSLIYVGALFISVV